jgi:hypothetical protein
MEPQVQILRRFRDNVLLNNSVGKAFVKLYYAHSPPIADVIAKHGTLRIAVRWALAPVVGVSWMALKIGPGSSLALMFLTGFVLVGLVGLRRKIKE